MITMYPNWKTDIASPSREMTGKVELYKGSTLSKTFLPSDNLSTVKIERTPICGKFFGFTISQKVTITVIDREGKLAVIKGDKLKPYLGTKTGLVSYPSFKVAEIARNEVKKEVKISGFDIIHDAADIPQSALKITYPITLKGYANAVATALNAKVKWYLSSTTFVDLQYTEENKPNFAGNETLREVLAGLAEATGTVVYADKDNNICFKQLSATPVDTIAKSQYFTLTAGKALKLTQVTKATELGDNVTAGTEGGFNQILHENPFLSLYPDVTGSLNRLVLMYKNIAFYPYKIKWRGNPALEIGDCISLSLGDNTKINIPYLGETVNYSGGVVVSSEWEEKKQDKIPSNPANLGEALKQTFAKVDKANKQIDIVASETAENREAIAAIKLTTGGIEQSVKEVEKKVGVAESAASDAKKAAQDASQSAQNASDKIDNLSVGGRNLLLDSGVESKNAEYRVGYYTPSRILEVGETVTVSICITPADKCNLLLVYNSSGMGDLAEITVVPNQKQIVTATFNIAYWGEKTPDKDILNNNIAIYRRPNDGTVTGETTIHWIKLEAGTVATDWTPAPEDIDAEIASGKHSLENTNEELKRLEESQTATDNSLTELTKEVKTKMTSEEMKIEINKAMSNGVNKVETSTGFSFNEEGLDITKTGSEMSTRVNEDGMRISKNGEVVLTANNAGVDATNLHATTWLIIGNNSRIEDYGTDRTGVFWIG